MHIFPRATHIFMFLLCKVWPRDWHSSDRGESSSLAGQVLWMNRCPAWKSSCVSLNVCTADWKMSSASIYLFTTVCWVHVNVYLKTFQFVEKIAKGNIQKMQYLRGPPVEDLCSLVSGTTSYHGSILNYGVGEKLYSNSLCTAKPQNKWRD